MEHWNENVQKFLQLIDIASDFIIHKTRAASAECELKSIIKV
jgi:hypothetical protein